MNACFKSADAPPAQTIELDESSIVPGKSFVSREEARKLGLPRYFCGEPCMRGHISERYTDNCSCVTCKREAAEEAKRLRGPVIWGQRIKWTEKNIEILRQGAAAGKKSHEIAADLGDARAKSAVIAKARRLGIPLLFKPQRPIGIPRLVVKPPRKPNGAEYQKGRSAASGRGLVPTHRVAALFVPPAPVLAAESRFLTILELEAKHCRFPLGDPREATFRYCGADKAGGGPYCLCHARMAVVPSERRAA